MLSPLDDFPVHQVPKPITTPASTDRHAYGRYWFGALDRLAVEVGHLLLLSPAGVFKLRDLAAKGVGAPEVVDGAARGDGGQIGTVGGVGAVGADQALRLGFSEEAPALARAVSAPSSSATRFSRISVVGLAMRL